MHSLTELAPDFAGFWLFLSSFLDWIYSAIPWRALSSLPSASSFLHPPVTAVPHLRPQWRVNLMPNFSFLALRLLDNAGEKSHNHTELVSWSIYELPASAGLSALLSHLSSLVAFPSVAALDLPHCSQPTLILPTWVHSQRFFPMRSANCALLNWVKSLPIFTSFMITAQGFLLITNGSLSITHQLCFLVLSLRKV